MLDLPQRNLLTITLGLASIVCNLNLAGIHSDMRTSQFWLNV